MDMSNTEHSGPSGKFEEGLFTPEQEREIFESWSSFLTCDHVWMKEPEESNFYYICDRCGGAQGLKMPKEGF